ncbi:hypothetical protein E4U53_007540 [Claviceps sorghi]|nr:hypothetical protein E4U53_007540 [Claviceps sorghi]
MDPYFVGDDHLYHERALAEPRDIIPRASPSQPVPTRPNQSPDTASTAHYSSALSALRALAIAPTSPPSPAGSHSGGLWPFSRSAAASPSGSDRRPSVPCLSSTYDTSYQYSSEAYAYDTGSNGPDRPLPTRQPSTYSRPKSIELLTPVMGR